VAQVRAGNDYRAIKQAIEGLEAVSAVYVERRMNANVQKAMTGHAVEDFK
jgi:molecular chaperone HscA